MKVLYIIFAVYFSYLTMFGKSFWSPKYKRAKPKTKTTRYYHK